MIKTHPVGNTLIGVIFMRRSSDAELGMTGLLSGLVNGMFGAGGGMVAVPMLEQKGTDPKRAHAETLGMMLVFSLVSIAVYSTRGSIEPAQAVRYLPGGILGAAAGCLIMKRISPLNLQKLFSCVMIYFGVRMLIN